jgi:hypothetical protein
VKVAEIIEKGNSTGGTLLILTKGEGQTLLGVFEKFCAEHKNQPKARKMMRDLINNLQCF